MMSELFKRDELTAAGTKLTVVNSFYTAISAVCKNSKALVCVGIVMIAFVSHNNDVLNVTNLFRLVISDANYVGVVCFKVIGETEDFVSVTGINLLKLFAVLSVKLSVSVKRIERCDKELAVNSRIDFYFGIFLTVVIGNGCDLLG